MKRNHFSALIALVCCVAITSCNSLEKEFEAYQQGYTPATESEAPAKYFPYEKVYVDVPDSMCSVLFMGQAKVATVYKSSYVLVPKTKATRAEANEYTIVNVAYSSQDGVESKNSLEMVVAFEDTKSGDHDYNDLVFQAKVDIVNKTDGSSQTSAEITPIAFGASRKVILGVILTDAENNVLLDKEIFKDCREEMFESDTSFINTLFLPRKKYEPIPVTLDAEKTGSVTGISWYIEIGGEKLFAANRFQACLDSLNMPQGLVIVDIREDEYFYVEDEMKYNCGNCFWQYPMESVDVSSVYPEFDKTFLTGGDFKVLATPAAGSRYFNAIMDDSLEVNDNDCLYTLYKPSNNSESGDMTPEAIQLWPGGPKWASCNIGATSITDPGLYFSWASIEGFKGFKETEDTGNGYDGELLDGNMFPDAAYYTSSSAGAIDTSNIAGNIYYDAARAQWGGEWRMPTFDEYQDLIKNTTYSWTDNYKGTGAPGAIFTSKTDQTKSIFFPAGGSVKNKNRQFSKRYANLWLATVPEAKLQPGNKYNLKYYNAYQIQLQNTDRAGISGMQRSFGNNIRPICE